MNDKQQLLTNLKAEFNRWEELLAGLNEAQITARQLPDNWSIKDVIAHLRVWQQRSVARMEAALSSREPDYPKWPADLDPEQEGEPHQLNAWLYETHRELSWASVYRDWRGGFLRFLELIEAVPETDLLEAGRYPWLDGHPLSAVLLGSYEHHSEHLETLRDWLREHRNTQTVG
ncbi:MAG: ClbS/DfsB family four-helix bundle protein [Chloroflexi bacterium]|nr:ClbS/DfsB family four-helix bundle protein [Chloroflexota bacterium]